MPFAPVYLVRTLLQQLLYAVNTLLVYFSNFSFEDKAAFVVFNFADSLFFKIFIDGRFTNTCFASCLSQIA